MNKIEYTPVVKNQKNNPFYKFRTRDSELLLLALQDRMLYICQLGSSRDATDQEVYKLLAVEPSKKLFGSAPHYNNQPNTGLAALAGAIDKLRRGDLSQKQVDHIKPTLKLLAHQYPRKFSDIEFVEQNTASVKVPLTELFDILEN
jgi:hypothetical protein